MEWLLTINPVTPLQCPRTFKADWGRSNDGFVPEDSVPGGTDLNGETTYVGRAVINGDLVPGKIVPSHRCIYVSYAGKEWPFRCYEYMIPPKEFRSRKYVYLDWRIANHGTVPTGAVEGGMDRIRDEKLFIGRAFYKGSTVIGKVHPSHRCIFIPFDGEEIKLPSYEILTIQRYW